MNRRSGTRPLCEPRHRGATRWWLVLAIALVTAGAALVVLWPGPVVPSTHDWEVPDPDTTGMERRVAELLHEARQAVLEEKDSEEAWGHFGAACDAHQLYPEAADCYQRAYELAPRNFRWPYLLAWIREWQGADADELVGLMQEAARLEPDHAAVAFRLGVVLLRQGRAREARDAYERAIDLNSTMAVAHRGLGQALVAAGETRRGLAHLERALKLAGPDGPVFAAMAQAYTRLGENARAEEASRMARRVPRRLALVDGIRSDISAMGISSHHCFMRSRGLIETGDYAKAVELLKIAEEYRTGDPVLQYRLGFSYLQLGKRQLALEHLSTAARLPGGMHRAFAALDKLFMNQANVGLAMAYYRRALKETPDDGSLRGLLAMALARHGQLAAALNEFAQAALHGPLAAELHYHWGHALQQQDRHEAALEQYRRALELWPDYVEAHFRSGLALERLGRTAEAIAQFERAVAADPDHDTAQRAAWRLDQLRGSDP